MPNLYDDDDDDDAAADQTKVTDAGAALHTTDVGKRNCVYLVVVAGGNSGEMHRIDASEIVVGRGDRVQIRIVDDNISRQHARLFREAGALYVEDLKSANGTWVNGERITKRVLNDGDKVSIGATTILKFTYTDRVDETFQQKMYEAALRDGLTKCYNKSFLLDRLPAEMSFARRHRADLTVMMLDIDHFKRVNDKYGHIAGDAVLVQVATIAQGALRAEDLLAR